MTNRLPIYLFSAVIALMAAVSSCNSDPIDYGDEYKTQNVAITSFRLLKNEKVLTNIDSVFFSIDLDNRRIFNADSLPKGTRIDKLPVVIGTSSVSRVDLIVPLAQGGDTTINYLTNPKDSIDFSPALSPCASPQTTAWSSPTISSRSTSTRWSPTR